MILVTYLFDRDQKDFEVNPSFIDHNNCIFPLLLSFEQGILFLQELFESPQLLEHFSEAFLVLILQKLAL